MFSHESSGNWLFSLVLSGYSLEPHNFELFIKYRQYAWCLHGKLADANFQKHLIAETKRYIKKPHNPTTELKCFNKFPFQFLTLFIQFPFEISGAFPSSKQYLKTPHHILLFRLGICFILMKVDALQYIYWIQKGGTCPGLVLRKDPKFASWQKELDWSSLDSGLGESPLYINWSCP